MNKHVFWAFAGFGLPLVLALFTIPILLQQIGADRFGLLSLAWGLVGYGGIFDLGLGRAITQRLSRIKGSELQDQEAGLITTAIRITMISGIAGMILFVAAGASGLHRFIGAGDIPGWEIALAIGFLGIALPLQAIGAVYRGICESHLKFKAVNATRVFLGVSNFAGPCLVATVSDRIYWLIAIMVASRLIALVAYRMIAKRAVNFSGEFSQRGYSRASAIELLSFGGWVTITIIVGPLITITDRFLIGTIQSASAITAYVIPYELTTQCLLVVSSVTAVLFPVISHQIRVDPESARLIFRRWLLFIVSAMAAILSGVALLMPYVLRLWIGDSLPHESIQVGRILCIGVFLNAVGCMYFSLLHATGNAKMTGILHAIELPLYVLLVFVLVNSYGLVGCAIAWSLRAGIDTAILMVMSRLVWAAAHETTSKAGGEQIHGICPQSYTKKFDDKVGRVESEHRLTNREYDDSK